MAALKQLEAINEKLLAYQRQLSNVSEALDALRAVADRLVVDLEEDRALVVDLVVALEGDENLTQPCDVASEAAPAATDTVQRLDLGDHIGLQTAETWALEEAPASIGKTSPDDEQPASAATPEVSSGIADGTMVALAPAPEAASTTDAVNELPHSAMAAHGWADQDQTIPIEASTAVALLPSEVEVGQAPLSGGAILDAAEGQTDTTLDQGTNPSALLVALANESEPLPRLNASASLSAATPIPDTLAAPSDAKVIDLASRRQQRNSARPVRRHAMAIVASLLLMAASAAGVHELLQSDLGKKMLELGTCEGEMVTANRNCAFLAWLLL